MQVYRQTIKKIKNNAGVQTNHKEDNKQCRCTDNSTAAKSNILGQLITLW